MIEAKFHLFQIQKKVAAPHSIIPPKLCFGECPETLDAVDMIPLFHELTLTVVNPVMPVTVGEKTVVGAKRIGINRAAFGDFLLDDQTENRAGDIRYGTGVHPAIALEKPENSDFSGCAPASAALVATAKVGLVNFDFSSKGSFTLAFPDDGIADEVVDPFGAVPMDAKLASGTDRWNLKREATDKLPDSPVPEATSSDEFLSHSLSIRKVKHLY